MGCYVGSTPTPSTPSYYYPNPNWDSDFFQDIKLLLDPRCARIVVQTPAGTGYGTQKSFKYFFPNG